MKNSRKSRMVHGAGVNDADYPVTIYAVTGGVSKQLWVCPVYSVWAHMIERCYGKKYQAKNPTYHGCTVVPEWHLFSAFRAWVITQDWEGKQLDKDILVKGNKSYSPDVCAFVPGDLNKFMTDSGAIRGECPIGVYRKKGSGKFVAMCRNPFSGKQEHLGMFIDENEAHEAWRKRKHELACTYAEQQSDPRIAKALRARYIEPIAV